MSRPTRARKGRSWPEPRAAPARRRRDGDGRPPPILLRHGGVKMSCAASLPLRVLGEWYGARFAVLHCPTLPVRLSAAQLASTAIKSCCGGEQAGAHRYPHLRSRRRRLPDKPDKVASGKSSEGTSLRQRITDEPNRSCRRAGSPISLSTASGRGLRRGAVRGRRSSRWAAAGPASTPAKSTQREQADADELDGAVTRVRPPGPPSAPRTWATRRRTNGTRPTRRRHSSRPEAR